jgi:hypothetical protein
VSEGLIRNYVGEDEFPAAVAVLRKFNGVTKISAAELMSVLTVLCEPMRKVFEHPNFPAGPDRSDLAGPNQRHARHQNQNVRIVHRRW